MVHIIEGIICLGIGFVGCWFIMKNNPKYFNIAKMGKDQLEALKAKVEAAIPKIK